MIDMTRLRFFAELVLLETVGLALGFLVSPYAALAYLCAIGVVYRSS